MLCHFWIFKKHYKFDKIGLGIKHRNFGSEIKNSYLLYVTFIRRDFPPWGDTMKTALGGTYATYANSNLSPAFVISIIA